FDQIYAWFVYPVGLSSQTLVLLITTRGIVPHINRYDCRAIQQLRKGNRLFLSVLYNVQFKVGLNFFSNFNHSFLIIKLIRYMKVNGNAFVPVHQILNKLYIDRKSTRLNSSHVSISY